MGHRYCEAFSGGKLSRNGDLAVVARAFAQSETHSHHAETRRDDRKVRHEHIAQL